MAELGGWAGQSVDTSGATLGEPPDVAPPTAASCSTTRRSHWFPTPLTDAVPQRPERLDVVVEGTDMRVALKPVDVSALDHLLRGVRLSTQPDDHATRIPRVSLAFRFT